MKISERLLEQLPEIAARTQAQLNELHREPSEVRAELMRLQLEGAVKHVQRLGEEMRRERTS